MREWIAKGTWHSGQGRDGSAAVIRVGGRDSSLEMLHASLMCLVAATRIPGHHAASGNCGRGGAGAVEGPAAKGESHPKHGYCRADHQHGAPQPPGPEKTSRASGEGRSAAYRTAGNKGGTRWWLRPQRLM